MLIFRVAVGHSFFCQVSQFFQIPALPVCGCVDREGRGEIGMTCLTEATLQRQTQHINITEGGRVETKIY